MKILETRVYRGPNLYALWPVIRLRVDLGELEHFPTTKLPGFSERLAAMIPSLAQHGCSYGEDGGFIRRMNETRVPGSATCWSTSRSSCRCWWGLPSPSARRAA